jgi:LysM repeat protein
LQQVVVTAGDTLWDVASRVASPSTDIRRLVWEIRRINGMTTAYLYPGQVLFVPER